MATVKFIVRDETQSTATRPNGAAAREKLLTILSSADKVIVDLDGVLLTPSFADEFLGILLRDIGEARFREAIVLENIPAAAKPLVRTVLYRRSKPFVGGQAVHH